MHRLHCRTSLDWANNEHVEVGAWLQPADIHLQKSMARWIAYSGQLGRQEPAAGRSLGRQEPAAAAPITAAWRHSDRSLVAALHAAFASSSAFNLHPSAASP